MDDVQTRRTLAISHTRFNPVVTIVGKTMFPDASCAAVPLIAGTAQM